jgi:CheY-like chemotaxis protein
MIRSVLIIDDQSSDRLVAARVIRKLAPESAVFEFANGQEALDFIQSAPGIKKQCGPFPPPTLLLVDINMPIMDGFEFLERLEVLAAGGEVQDSWFAIAMFTSSSNPSDRERASAISCVRDYVVKPLTIANFEALLEKHFRLQNG